MKSTIPEQQIIGLKGAVESFQLHDTDGNACAAALFKTGPDSFELALWRFNDAHPVIYRDRLAILKNVMNHFFYARLAEGFIQPLADENGKAINS